MPSILELAKREKLAKKKQRRRKYGRKVNLRRY